MTDYLSIGSALDITPKSEWIKYRFYEMIPGILLWLTLFLLVLGSYLVPAGAAIFIILFDVYWFLRTVYFSIHLRNAFKTMHIFSSVDWYKKLDELKLPANAINISDWRRDIWHILIIPFYKESYDVLKSTLDGVIACRYPNEKIILVLTGEERAGEDAKRVGEKIRKEYQGKFTYFYLTFHQDKKGELAGKGANETWAVKKAKEEIIDKVGIPYEKIICSVFDADTVPAPSYFARLTYMYLTSSSPLRSSFQPIPFFINNIWEAPALARVIAFSSTFWHLTNQMRPERLTSFSSHSFPFKAMEEVGFWQTNIVSEDSRIFWQSYLKFDGDWRVEPMFVPVSMDANVAESFWKTMKNLYLQQRRWAYGSENIPYFLYGFGKNKKIKLRDKLYWTYQILEGFWSWPTNSLMIFLLGWLPIILGGSAYNVTVLAYNTPRLANWIMTFAMIGIISSIYFSIRLLPPRPTIYGRHKYILMIAEWFLIPLTLILFGSIPAIDAETRLMTGRYLGFWTTPKIRKGFQKQIFS